jgi:hypothetical protein
MVGECHWPLFKSFQSSLVMIIPKNKNYISLLLSIVISAILIKNSSLNVLSEGKNIMDGIISVLCFIGVFFVAKKALSLRDIDN